MFCNCSKETPEKPLEYLHIRYDPQWCERVEPPIHAFPGDAEFLTKNCRFYFVELHEEPPSAKMAQCHENVSGCTNISIHLAQIYQKEKLRKV